MDRIFATIDSVEREIFPNDYRPSKFVSEQEEGWIFYRITYSGSMTLTGDDFDDFMAVAEDCEKQLIRIEREGLNDWNGFFSIIDGEVNIDDCVFTFTPRLDDDYDIFLEEGGQDYNIMNQPAITVVSGVADNYANCRDLRAVIQGMIDQIDNTFTLDSDFLNAADSPVYPSIPNRYRYLAIAQNSDIKVPDATEPVRYAYITFLDLMTWLRDTFQIYWSIEGTDLVIEHVSYYYSDVDVDLRADRGDVRAQRYFFNQDKMFRYEKFVMQNSALTEQSIDFVEQYISYREKCTLRKDNELIRSVPFSTDIESLEDTDITKEFPDDGYFLFACSNELGSRNIYTGVGYVSGMNHRNVDMSYANLIDMFWRHERIRMIGYWRQAASIDEEFFTAQPNKIQQITVSICDEIDPYANYLTELGDTLGVDGRLLRAERSTNGGTTRLTIGYGYPPVYVPSPDPPGKTITLFQAVRSPDFLKATFSELSGIGLTLTVDWWVYSAQPCGVPTLVDNDSYSWNVDSNVMEDVEQIIGLPAYVDGYRYVWDITASEPSWDITVNQSPELDCMTPI